MPDRHRDQRIDAILRQLPDAKANGKGWKAPCPAHDDANPSFTFGLGDSGHVLLHCFRGCEPDNIVAALGMTMAQLMPPADSVGWLPAKQKSKQPKVYATRDQAIAAVARSVKGTVEAVYDYHHADGSIAFTVVRLMTPTGKSYRPTSPTDGGWRIGDPDGPLPLFNLPALAAADEVVVAEGEKCSVIASSLGAVATTSAHGAQSASKTDWSPLAGKTVILMPDNDDAGRQYAADVAAILLGLPTPAKVRLLTLPGLPEHGDIAELLAAKRADGIEHDEIAEDFARMVEGCAPFDAQPDPSVSSVGSSAGPSADSEAGARAAPGASVSSVSSSLGPSPEFRPLRPLPNELLPVPAFDPHLLPQSFRPWIEDIANRIQCPIEFPAVASLVTYSSVVGRRIAIRPKQCDDWTVVPNLWGGVVGRPGVMKTPGIQEAMKQLRRLEADGKAAFDREAREHEARMLVTKAKEKDTDERIKQAIKKGDDPMAIARMAVDEVHDAPVRRRYLTNDVTVEKYGELISENPNGLQVFRDELTGLLRSLDKEGHEGARAFYLEAWNGTGAFTFDRIGRGTVEIPAAIVSILGGIQPGPLAAYLQAALRSGAGDDGLIQRFQMLVYPDVSHGWRNVDAWPMTKERDLAWSAYQAASVLDPHVRGAEIHEGEIPFLRLTPAAQEAFDAWRGQLELKVRSGEDHAAIEAHLAKYRSLVPSLALLLHLADSRVGPVALDIIQSAVAWTPLLEAHARRIYGLSLGSNLQCRAIAKHLLNRDLEDGFDARRVYRANWAHLGEPVAVEAGLEQLVQLGWLAEQHRPTAGRTATIYRINPGIWERASGGTDRTDRSPLTTVAANGGAA